MKNNPLQLNTHISHTPSRHPCPPAALPLAAHLLIILSLGRSSQLYWTRTSLSIVRRIMKCSFRHPRVSSSSAIGWFGLRSALNMATRSPCPFTGETRRIESYAGVRHATRIVWLFSLYALVFSSLCRAHAIFAKAPLTPRSLIQPATIYNKWQRNGRVHGTQVENVFVVFMLNGLWSHGEWDKRICYVRVNFRCYHCVYLDVTRLLASGRWT